MAEEDPQVGLGVGALDRMRPSRLVGRRIDAHDLDPRAADLDRPLLVPQEHRSGGDRGSERSAGPDERVTRVVDVVVAEHREDAVARLEPPERLLELLATLGPAHEIARDGDEVGRASFAQATAWSSAAPAGESVPRWRSER